jgi:ribosome biogenesis protein ENP2
MKVERGIDSEVLQMRILSDDYSKVALLCDDRNIELHAQYGRHFKIRIPKFGRDIVYNPHTADILAVGASNEIYRLNLGLGRFQSPLETSCPELNCIDYSSQLELAAVGGIDGRVEFWDMGQRQKAHSLDLPSGMQGQEIKSICFNPQDALQVAIGTEKGKVMLYDMRYPVPIYTLTHHYRLPIQTIKFHSASRKILTSDKKIIKIFNEVDGSLFTNIEPKVQINDMEIPADNSGLIFVPLE